MRIRKTRRFQQAFVLTSEDVGRLVAALSELGSINITTRCSDGTDREFEDSSELLEFENASSSAIQQLKLAAPSEFMPNSVVLEFKGERSTYTNPVEVTMYAEDDSVPRIFERVLEILEGTRPWFSWLSRANFIIVGFGLFVALWLALVAGFGFGWVDSSITNQPEESTHIGESNGASSLGWVGLPIAIVVGGWLLNSLRDRFFPMGTFAIGQGDRRHQRLERMRWGVIAAGFVSVAVSLLLGWLLP